MKSDDKADIEKIDSALDDEQKKLNNHPNESDDKSNVLVKITVRLEKKVITAIDQIAKSYDLNRTVVMRLILANRLDKYLSRVQYVDREQADEIRKMLTELADQINDMRSQLRYIGNNYNQEIKIKHIREKYGNLRNMTVDSIGEMQKEIEKAEAEGSALDKNDIEEILRRFDSSAHLMGQGLWRIRG